MMGDSILQGAHSTMRAAVQRLFLDIPLRAQTVNIPRRVRSLANCPSGADILAAESSILRWKRFRLITKFPSPEKTSL